MAEPAQPPAPNPNPQLPFAPPPARNPPPPASPPQVTTFAAATDAAVDPRPIAVTADIALHPHAQKVFGLPQGKTGAANLNITEARVLGTMGFSFSAARPVFTGTGYVNSPVPTPTTGTILTAKPGSIIAKPAATLTYQWTKNGTNIAAATAATYTVVAGDLAALITCKVTATNASGATTSTLAGVRPA